MNNVVCRIVLLVCLSMIPFVGYATANLEVNTPAIVNLKQSMQSRHGELAPYYVSGAVGLTYDGLIAIRDANSIPLAKRQLVNSFVAAENQDRSALYREIARANSHPEWEKDIRVTFSQRWINLAKPGWWYQTANSTWARK